MNVSRIYSLLILLSAIVFAWASSSPAADQSVWPLTPYQVRVYVAIAPGPPFSPRLESELCANLASRIEAVVGPPWNVTVSSPPAPLSRAMLRDLGELQAGDVPIPSPEGDKILLVTATAMPGGILVTARDFDVRTRTLSTAVVRPIWQTGSLCDASLDALLSAFAPLARIDRADKDFIYLRVKAAGLPTRDPGLALVRPGDVFRPIIRLNNRNSTFNKATLARWSYGAVEKVSPEETLCRIHSGMRGEIAMKGRGRIEPLALRVRSPGGSTMVAIQSRAEPKPPLAGCDIYAYPPDKKDAVAFLGQTDRQGRLLVPSIEGSMLRVLLVKNGSALLAKLPIMPGLERRLTAELANDDQRLKAEGFITGLQEEVFDTIARQKILAARIHARIEAGEFDKASGMILELRELPTGQQYVLRLGRERDILASNDTAIQKKIDMLMNDTRQLIDKNFDLSLIENLERELREARTSGVKTAGEK